MVSLNIHIPNLYYDLLRHQQAGEDQRVEDRPYCEFWPSQLT
jgi:hypothetical protein